MTNRILLKNKVCLKNVLVFKSIPKEKDKSNKNEFIKNYLFPDEWGRKFVIIKNMAAIKNIWSKIGNMITGLIINFIDIDLNQGNEIMKFINAEASKWLTLVFLDNCTLNVFDELSNEFNKVVILAFSRSETADFEFKDDQRLSKIFPNLKKLAIKEIKVSDWSLLDDQTKLTELVLRPNGAEEKIIQCFKRNPLLNGLQIHEINQSLLKQINENIPKLKVLKLINLHGNFDGDPIHFVTVDALAIENSSIIPENIFFDHLRILHLVFNLNEFTDKWLNYINTKISNSVSFFHLIVEKLSKELFLDIPDKLPKISFAYIQCETPFSADEIKQFLDKAINLFEFKMRIPQEHVDINLLEKAVSQAEKTNNIWKVDKSTHENNNDHLKYQTFSM